MTKSLVTLFIFVGAAIAQSPAAKDAVTALRTLNTATEIGINFRDYSTRVIDTKVKLDAYEAQPVTDDAALRAKLDTIMQMYVIAAKAWGANITKDYPGRQRAAELAAANPEILACPNMPIQPLVKASDAQIRETMEAAQRALERARRLGVSTDLSPEMKASLEQQKERERRDREHRKDLNDAELGSNPGILWKCAADKLASMR
jgi:hypothetical protein